MTSSPSKKRIVIQHVSRGTFVAERPSVNVHGTLAEWRPQETRVPKEAQTFDTWDDAFTERDVFDESYRGQYAVETIEAEA